MDLGHIQLMMMLPLAVKHNSATVSHPLLQCILPYINRNCLLKTYFAYFIRKQLR